MGMFELSFGELEDLLMGVLRVPADRRQRLRSRIHYLQRQGFVRPIRPGGSGHHNRYDDNDTLQLLFALVLMDIGWASQEACQFVQLHWGAFREQIDAAPHADALGVKGGAGLLLNPHSLRTISPGLRDDPPTSPTGPGGATEPQPLAASFINVSGIMALVDVQLSRILG